MKKSVIILIVIIAVIVGGFAWFWYSYRPSEIKKQCHEQASGFPTTREPTNIYESYQYSTYGKPADTYDSVYEKCIHEKGL